MAFDPVLSVRSDAFAVGMKATCNDLPSQDVDVMVTRAEEALGRDDPLFRAVTTFAVQYELHRYDKAALFEIGQTLTEAVRLASLPDAPFADRADIYG